MWQDVEALVPTVAMTAVFVALLVTAFRATDGSRRKGDHDEDRNDD